MNNGIDDVTCIRCGEPAESGHLQAGVSILWRTGSHDDPLFGSLEGVRARKRGWAPARAERLAPKRWLTLQVPRLPAYRCRGCHLFWFERSGVGDNGSSA